MNFQLADSGLLPLKRGRIIKTLADNTISGIVDAIVELVTNADDAYKRAVESTDANAKTIDIIVTRAKGGKCTEIKVKDEATGMSYAELKGALEFSGDTSGFKEGKSVRGFFGRGLKESIIALGEGTILTYKEGLLSKARIYYDSQIKDANYEISVGRPSDEDLKSLEISGESGTLVTIDVTNEKKSYIPASDTFFEQFQKHFALRGINSSPLRKITLTVREPDKAMKDSNIYPVKYVYPSGKLVYENDAELKGESSHVKIFESEESLETPLNFHGEAGLLIKTEGAILDNRLFGFESEPAALYFFGEVNCPSIATIIRKEEDESIVDFNRGGLNWKHDHNKKLQEALVPILKPLISEKRNKISSQESNKIPQNVNKALEKICRKLSSLARGLLEDELPGQGEIESFVIRPMFANIEPEKARTFYIYCPQQLADAQGTHMVEIASINPAVVVLNDKVVLKDYPKDMEVLYESFQVAGTNEGDTSTILASLGKLLNTCEVRVGPLGKGGKRKKRSRGGGLFTKIEPSSEENPSQRFSYSEGGVIRVYTKFPGVNKYVGDGFSNIDSIEGKTILAEILIEAFSRYISTRMAGRMISEELYVVLNKMDELRALSSADIYDLVFSTNFKETLALDD